MARSQDDYSRNSVVASLSQQAAANAHREHRSLKAAVTVLNPVHHGAGCIASHFRFGRLLQDSRCNTQSFQVVCDSPSPGTSWRNRENPAPLRAHASATIGTETVATLVKVRRMQLCAFLCLLCGQETHASATQSDLLLLPTRNGPCREDGALRREYLFSRVQHPPP